MKRLTLALDDDLLRRLRRDAAERGMTLSALVSGLLNQAMHVSARRSKFKLRLQGWDAELQPGVDILSRDQLLDLA